MSPMFSSQEYAKLQVTQPKVREGMELVEQPSDDLFPCSCHRTKVRPTGTFSSSLKMWLPLVCVRCHCSLMNKRVGHKKVEQPGDVPFTV